MRVVGRGRGMRARPLQEQPVEAAGRAGCAVVKTVEAETPVNPARKEEARREEVSARRCAEKRSSARRSVRRAQHSAQCVRCCAREKSSSLEAQRFPRYASPRHASRQRPVLRRAAPVPPRDCWSAAESPRHYVSSEYVTID